MKKTVTALTAAAALVAAVSLAPSDAFAQRRGNAVAAGVLGLAAGAIIGGAIVNSGPGYYPAPYGAYGPPPGYVAYPAYGAAYGAPYPAACPGGYWARRPLYGPYGEFMGYSRPRFTCPY
jgi:hypothetical protein